MGSAISYIAGRFEVIDQLSGSSIKEVFKCKDRESGEVVVVNYFKEDFLPAQNVYEKLPKIQKAFLVPIVCSGFYNYRFYSVFHYIDGGNLSCSNRISEEVLSSKLIPHILLGLKQLHDVGVLHLQVQPSSLYYSRSEEVMLLGHYGQRSLLADSLPLWSIECFSNYPYYVAPECFGGVYSYAADYYCLGLTIISLLTANNPYSDRDNRSIIASKARDSDQLTQPPGLSERMITLIAGLVAIEPAHRFGFAEVKDWLNGRSVRIVGKTAFDKDSQFIVKISPGIIASNTDELALMLLNNPESGKRLISSNEWLPAIRNYDSQLAALIQKRLRESTTRDAALVSFIYTLSPGLPYRLTKGYSASNPKELIDIIDLNMDTWNAAKEQLRNGMIPAWLKAAGHLAEAEAWETARTSL